VNTSDSPSHIPTIFGFGPVVAKCEQHAYPKAAAFLSCMLEIIDLISTGNVFHIQTHTQNRSGESGYAAGQAIVPLLPPEGKNDASHHPIGK